VEVTLSEIPQFSWDPPCHADYFEIRDITNSSRGRSVWHLFYGYQTIPPPLTYGVVPEGVEEIVKAVPLIAGNVYRVEVTRRNGYEFQSVGTAEFVYSAN
jgi:hypothetical protein